MKTVVEILGFSSGTRVAAGMFDGLKEGIRLFGRLLAVGYGMKQVGVCALAVSAGGNVVEFEMLDSIKKI